MNAPDHTPAPGRGAPRLAGLERMLERLGDTLAAESPSEVEAAAAIHFFEVTTELAWKAVKDRLDAEGLVVRSPKAAFRHALQQGWASTHDTEALLVMVDKRNEFSHRCDEGLLREVRVIGERFLPALRRLHDRLVQEAGDAR
ncbi:nucleotidyltransferase substrate binding protein [Phycisphaera mikurensis]|uniref:Nucleotidyltransferase substrate binding protein n=1 Tax=Phycisphaera mikurensis (strain NBRC 102666 / KCTC 22515 / FYK2301M01) TaxID=1142394 RepID=I0IAQ1_PHYMF|nr:nucleotidyltransferase substrate binding protein [Phycisphaera mikurensis]MBB6441666.1 nucleotidyltransferase substrate binding protein (TIGR01987 family) [Phycisphaera mikurensis]BAM02339.1 hypothetical protein PSMK_01800 [Phycisphaera mikurensis NBRC 102666]